MQYTKNTVTGASTADAVVVLIDARKGVLEQTRRHLSVLQLLRVAARDRGREQDRPRGLQRAGVPRASRPTCSRLARELGLRSPMRRIADLLVVPVSALDGDNVVDRSERTPWYTGPGTAGGPRDPAGR